jgi:hypothetical protein
VSPQAGDVGTFIVPMWHEVLAEELAGKDPGLGEAPDSASHLKVNVSIQCMHVQVILLYRLLWKEGKRNFHALKSVQGCTEVKVLDVQAHVLSPLRAEDTVLFHINFDVVRLMVHVESLPR